MTKKKKKRRNREPIGQLLIGKIRLGRRDKPAKKI